MTIYTFGFQKLEAFGGGFKGQSPLHEGFHPSNSLTRDEVPGPD